MDRLKGVYQIGDTGDQRKERDGQNQPLRVDDLVRVKLDNTERANKLCPLYSEHIYKIQTVNKVSNTYVITRVNTEAPGMRTKRFLYHRRNIKNSHAKRSSKRILDRFSKLLRSNQTTEIGSQR